MAALLETSASMDCRGASYGHVLEKTNMVLVTKVRNPNGTLKLVEVSCSHLSGRGDCLVNGVPCPHLKPVSR